MLIESAVLSGFRCFAPRPISVTISPKITTIVGPNAAGKTALLHALAKLFGVTRAQRTVRRSDFHLGPDDDPTSLESKHLYIEVLIALPELIDGTATPETIAPSFRHMLIERPDDAPVCRLRLDAQWEDDGTVEGEVSQTLHWVDTLDDAPPEDKCHPVSVADRGLIQLYYTPASRDAAAQTRATAGALAARLLRAIEWSSDTEEAVHDATENLASAFEEEAAIAAITEALQTRWSALHDDVVDTNPRLSLVSRRFEEVVNKIAVMFEQGPDGQERGIEALSDGQQSLFYFALAAAVFDLEREVVAGSIEGFRSDALRIPALTIFALEEPENHLSPYFLARIIRQVRSLTTDGSAQAIVTSHSPAVLSRVNPTEVRYCRCDPKTRVSTVKRIKLPVNDVEASKFVRGAMLAYPELYFARFVLLVEGDSERIVLPRLAEALNLLIDPAFVAIVPLGGRHVQHFWRLLKHLGIPHATLLDLDLGRDGGGFRRVKTAIEKLIEFGAPKAEVLRITTGILSDADLANMHNWPDSVDHSGLLSWINNNLKAHGVYFSSPLDLDLAMLEAFPAAYAAIVPERGGSRMAADKAAEVVLGTAGPGLKAYTGPFVGYPPQFPSYRYHFLTNSKPATHLAALTHITKAQLVAHMPVVLASVLKHISASLRRD
ncbi:ATP-dependent nuclease [Pseudomonas cannabina]|uniref:ATP-dependent nuclease n=1 Tax=Pseudomonas cannabina TaxID=86840 RepID=UPI0006D5EC1C|nr:AAA family ATPase [Pseudomonas cannabina]KAA8699621.1 AAA family ATPase [Pseudomonas cannabina]SDR37811.1 putative ATP-dependent endonuclease of the OLD family [Pseudomonas cannabina]